MRQKIILFLKHIHRFGLIRGVEVFFKNNIFTNIEFKINLPNYLQPIYLRKNTSDIATFNQVLVELEYDYKLKEQPKFIIDCGANIGLSSIFFQSKFPNSTVIAIEPEISNFNQLVKNTSSYKNIKCVNNGIWDKSSILEVVDERNFGHWGFECKVVETESVNTIVGLSINDVLEQNNRYEIDLLKIDIEGAELELFSNNYENWLPKTKVIMIELHDSYRLGCSKSFFSAIIKYDFSVFHRGENIICIRN
jgi:FkbM family methyltransferase